MPRAQNLHPIVVELVAHQDEVGVSSEYSRLLVVLQLVVLLDLVRLLIHQEVLVQLGLLELLVLQSP